MRKITKKLTLSKAYKRWHDAQEKAKKDHPEYNSTKDEYYWDVAMNLFYCQAGLCAYTEIQLASNTYYDVANWDKSHRYINPFHPKKIEVKGQLEHFDSTLKKKKSWLWSNLFMADSDVNTKIKSVRPINNILKPDKSSYDEFKLLYYNRKMHLFIANPKLSAAKQKKVNDMIITLGINYRPIIDQRRTYVEMLIKGIDYGIEQWSTVNITQFPTAIAMIRKYRL